MCIIISNLIQAIFISACFTKISNNKIFLRIKKRTFSFVSHLSWAGAGPISSCSFSEDDKLYQLNALFQLS